MDNKGVAQRLIAIARSISSDQEVSKQMARRTRFEFDSLNNNMIQENRFAYTAVKAFEEEPNRANFEEVKDRIVSLSRSLSELESFISSYKQEIASIVSDFAAKVV